MLAILGLFAMALTAALVIDPDPENQDVTADGVSDFNKDLSSGEAAPVTDLFEAQDSASSFEEMDGAFFDFSDQTNVTAFATDLNDEMWGGTGSDYLSGRDGDDTIAGAEGSDELHGELGDDILWGEDGSDSLFGHVGDDQMFGGLGADKLTGGSGDDALFGGGGDDSLSGGLDDDTLSGGDGEDVLFGGKGDDILIGSDDRVPDFLNGGDGDDVILAGVLDSIHSGTGSDTITVPETAQANLSDFDPQFDQIEIEYEGETPPILSISPNEEGISLLADGAVVMLLQGIEELDLSTIKLIRAEP